MQFWGKIVYFYELLKHGILFTETTRGWEGSAVNTGRGCGCVYFVLVSFQYSV